MSGQSYEYAAKTVEEATAEGLRQLGASRDQVEIEVLHQGSRGILGIGATDARVRITVKPTPSEPPAEPMPAPPQPEDVPAASAQTPTATPETPEPEAEPVGKTAPAALPEASAPSVAADESSSELAEDEPLAVESAEEISEEDGAEEDGAEEDGAEEEELEEEDDPELADLAYDLLAQMLQHLGIRAEIEVSWLDDPEGGERPLNLNVIGDDVSVLIGRNGETLASIQYLIRLMVNQELHRWTNIIVDVDSYKQRRAEQLTQLAHRLADQVISSGRAVSLEPMPASERRLVHIALRNHQQVYTESTGEDQRRKVQILPK